MSKQIKNLTICRKMKLIMQCETQEEAKEFATYLFNARNAQYRGMNILMGQLASSFYANGMDLKSEQFLEDKKNILSTRNPNLEDIEFAVGLDTMSLISQKVQQDFSTAIKNGLMKGERSIPTYKSSFPILTRGRNVKFRHGYATHQEFLDNLYSNDLDVYIDWANKKKFKIVFGNVRRSAELRSVIKNIFEEQYKVQGSSITVEKKGSAAMEITLNLSISIPVQENKLDEDVIVGVNLGMIVPAMCALNTDSFTYKEIGSAEDFSHIRVQLQEQRKRLQKALVLSKSGHGRTRKLKAMERLRERERNFVKTYNHMVSRNVVDFAFKHNAKYINMEDLSSIREKGNEYVLRNWSYYELQSFIEYKAKLKGIAVRKVKAFYHSQTCFECGTSLELDKATRKVYCPICKTERDVDYNAAKNNAMSTEFVK